MTRRWHTLASQLAILAIMMAVLLCRCGLAQAASSAPAETAHSCCKKEKTPPCHSPAEDSDKTSCPHCSGSLVATVQPVDQLAKIAAPDMVVAIELPIVERPAIALGHIASSFITIEPATSPLRMKCALNL